MSGSTALLGNAEASDIPAGVDAQEMSGVLSRNSQNGSVHKSPFALGFWTLVDVCDVKVSHEDRFLSSFHEGANLDYSCNQRVRVSPFHPDTGAPWHEGCVIPVQDDSHLEFF